ncbi:MAG: hypothetical protein ACRD29_22780 [Acidimicrobiales bacterium]
MTTTSPTTDIAVVDPQFADAERHALAAFLAGYRGLTRDAYALDLRQFIAWCEERRLRLFDVRRADIECYARDLEDRGRARALAPPPRHSNPSASCSTGHSRCFPD